MFFQRQEEKREKQTKLYLYSTGNCHQYHKPRAARKLLLLHSNGSWQLHTTHTHTYCSVHSYIEPACVSPWQWLPCRDQMMLYLHLETSHDPIKNDGRWRSRASIRSFPWLSMLTGSPSRFTASTSSPLSLCGSSRPPALRQARYSGR
uniref:Uncharacterized protein n=1 Tax=Arundo donax TaxID=35708 RepID=A0A0A9F4D7_ARUDO